MPCDLCLDCPKVDGGQQLMAVGGWPKTLTGWATSRQEIFLLALHLLISAAKISQGPEKRSQHLVPS